MLLLTAAGKDDIDALVQKTFDAMAAKDGALIESCFTKDACLIAIRDTGESTSTNASDFAKRLSTSTFKTMYTKCFDGAKRVISVLPFLPA